ncbi:MAG TPA: UDP-N-acetylmuramate dehydrogenase [Rugosimonospora sp.]|nr:UDP-N-acetylmuramate dehydrogenase [Rugosimonospora sp.]
MPDTGDLLIGPHTTLRLGGAAGRVVTAGDRGEIVQSVRDAAKLDEPLLVLAGGSNVVVGDAGFAGTLLLVRSTGVRIEDLPDGGALLTAEAGQAWDEVVRASLAAGLAGLECLSGIPGSAGATVIQNVGAYGHEVAEVLHAVPLYDRDADEVRDFSPEQCRLGFRTSLFKRNERYVVLAVTFRLHRSPQSAPVMYAELARTLGVEVGARVPAERVREAVLRLRTGKGMVLDPADPDTYSVGSFFQNPVLSPEDYPPVRAAAVARVGAEPPSWPYDGLVKVSAAWLIERAGYGKGYQGGHPGVGISTKHTLALTNRGTGTTAALLDLAREIREGVRSAFGVTLEPEAVLVGCDL